MIKYAPTNTAKLTITGPVTCLSSIYAPIIFTARDDHSVGEAIGSAPLSGMYANTALFLDNMSSGQIYEFSDLRISHADTAIRFNFGNGHKLRNLQVVNCNYAVSSQQSSFQVLNALFSRINNSAVHPAFTSGTIGTLQNVTIRECNTLVPQYGTANAINCLFIAVTNIGSGSFSGSFNGTNSNPTNVFQPVGAGYSYLTNNSPFRNAGTTSIDSTLLASLKQLTTYPPIVAGHVTTIGNANLTLAPQALRDTDAPDLGYHYPPLDYAFGGVFVTNSTITVQTGAAVAFYSPTNAGSSYGLRLGSGAKFFSDGSPTNLNELVRYNAVQEQSTSAWNTPAAESVSSAPSSVSATPEARFTFTQCSSPAADSHHFYGIGTDLAAVFQHSEFIGGKFQTDRPKVSITNCLFHRVDTIINGASNQFNLTFQNCLLYGGTLKLTNSQGGTWKVSDSVFDGTSVSQSGPITHDYNGYITNATGQWLTNSGSHDVFTNSFTWFTLGSRRFYQLPGTVFINKGSTNANNLGLYHFTATTSNVKETNSIVDPGYHYIALNAQNQPFDSDGDGIPDYLEDPDGDGLTDPGENSFANPVLSVPNSVDYMRGSPPKRLNPAATAYDIDTPNFGGGQLSVWTVAYATPNDHLGIHNEGTGAQQIGVAGDTISYGGVSIGTFRGGISDSPLTVFFNGNASSAAVQALVRNVTFHNVSSIDAISTRILQYTLSDGTGGATNTFQTVNIVCAHGIDVMLLIDVSKSLETNEFEQAKAAASSFVSLLNSTNDRVGLISFAGSASLNSPLTTNYPAVQSMIMGLTTNGGTLFHPPLNLGRTNLAASTNNVMPLIVLLSDGRVGGLTPGASEAVKSTNRVLALEAALAVKAAGIRLVTIAYGTNGGLNDGTNLMRTFATSPGDYYYAPNAADIEAKYVEIAEGLCRGLTPPQIAITSPANSTELPGPARFRIETSTSDSDGFVKKVQFFNGSTSLGIVTNQPFQFIWNNVTNGTYSLTAVATDDDNLTNTSSAVVITITNCPIRTLSSFTLASYNLFGGLSTAGQITISGDAPRGGQTVLLSCTNPYVSIPPSVTIPQNTNTVSFQIDTRGVPIDQSALIFARLNNSTQSTALNLATNAYGPGVFRGQCGPMDVAFIVPTTQEPFPFGVSDTTNSFFVLNAATKIVDMIELMSGGDYQLALVGVDRIVRVREQFTLTNRSSFLSNFYSLPSTNDHHQAWDEALNTVVNNLTTNNRPNQDISFTNKFRAHARKIIVLLGSRAPMGFTNAYESGLDDVNAHLHAVEAYLKGIEVSVAHVLHHGEELNQSVITNALRDLAATTGGVFVPARPNKYYGQGLDIDLPSALSRCGAQNGEVVFVRDDQRQLAYSAFTLNDATKEVAAREVAGFDLTGIDGAITGARARRSGQLLQKYGSYFDVQIGVRSSDDTNLVSYGGLLADAHTNGVALYYDNQEWDLPFSFYPDLEQRLGNRYLVELLDRVSGACGNNFEVIDTPAADYPSYRNALTFKVLRPLQIPQGRCRDFILSSANLPVSATWTISLWGQTIASAGFYICWSAFCDGDSARISNGGYLFGCRRCAQAGTAWPIP